MADAGRPYITIDWKVVDSLLEAGCKGYGISAYIGIHHDTLYDRCVKEKGMSFSDYSAKMRAKGDSMLEVAQFKNAMNGNTSMQIWLGKQRLGQKEQISNQQENPYAQKIAEIQRNPEDLVGRSVEL